MAYEVRRVSPGEAAGSHRVKADDVAAQMYPAVWSFIVTDHWPDDGKPRLTGSLLIFVDEGVWKACLNDRAQHRVAFVSGADPADLMEKVETGLQAGSLDWRVSRKR